MVTVAILASLVGETISSQLTEGSDCMMLGRIHIYMFIGIYIKHLMNYFIDSFM